MSRHVRATMAAVVSALLCGVACHGQSTCKVEDAGAVTARYIARMRLECDGLSFDDCPARAEIEADRKARLEAACPTK